MAKKKAARPKATRALTSLTDLAADAANPRQISDESAEGLRKSISRFGDLSGIVWNKRTGELIAGHQRVSQIRAEYGTELAIEPINEAAGIFGIRVSDEQYFPVRVVDWSPAMQRAANVAANNPKLQGKFTAELATYLLTVEAELAEEMPGVLDDCLMVELMAAGIDTSDAKPAKEAVVSESFQVIVQCVSEDHQREVYEELTGDGMSCKLLTL